MRNDFVRNLFFAVPNGAWLGGKSAAMMVKLKKEGFLAVKIWLEADQAHVKKSLETIRRKQHDDAAEQRRS